MNLLDKLQEVAEGATRGPWRRRGAGEVASACCTCGENPCYLGGSFAVCAVNNHALDQGEKNAAYIAALSPDVALALIGIVRAAEDASDIDRCPRYPQTTCREAASAEVGVGVPPGMEWCAACRLAVLISDFAWSGEVLALDPSKG